MKKLILYFFSLLSCATLFAGTYYDTGQKPTIALNDNNVVVEVHISDSNDTVAWSRVGDLNKENGSIDWRGDAEKIDHTDDIEDAMMTQQLCLNDNGVVAYLYVKEDDNKMCIMIGVVDGNNIKWSAEPLETGYNYTHLGFDYNMTIALTDKTLLLVGQNYIMKEWSIYKQRISEINKIFENIYNTEHVSSKHLLGACIARSTGEILLFRDDDTSDPNDIYSSDNHESVVYINAYYPTQSNEIRWNDLDFSFDAFGVATFEPNVGVEYIVMVYGEDDIKDNAIFYKLGKYEHGKINWKNRTKFDTGKSNDSDCSPKVSANSDGWMVESHQSQNDKELYYNVGQFDGTGETGVINWKKPGNTSGQYI